MGNRAFGFFAAAAGIAILFASCGSDSARISGHYIGSDSQQILLERVLPSGITVVDTTLTDSKGLYRFEVGIPGAQPTIFHIKIKDNIIPLILSPGERVTVSSMLGNPIYAVEGSKESSLTKEVNDIFRIGLAKLDSISEARPLYDPDGSQKTKAVSEYVKTYYDIKKDQIDFIIKNASSLAAVYALYQRLPGDDILFNGDSDYVFYRMVADSVGKHYPGSPYLDMLLKDLAEADAEIELLRELDESIKNPVSFPEIEMPDIYGTLHKLSDNIGKVIILDFWSASESRSAMVNAEYKELYVEFAPQGLVIYQVNVDASKINWVNAVVNQRLPWITVSDLTGLQSIAVKNYNISSIPANYLINAEGDIVSKNVYGETLRREVAEMIKEAGRQED